jgi:hypothetical protein
VSAPYAPLGPLINITIQFNAITFKEIIDDEMKDDTRESSWGLLRSPLGWGKTEKN